MAFRIAYTAPEKPSPRRRPRVKDGAHLDCIRKLPCIACGARPVQAAHIRSPSPQHGKRETGIGERPSDVWVLPLCPPCHLDGPGAQHKVGEANFYRRININPFTLALALWAAEGDVERMEQIICATWNARPEP